MDPLTLDAAARAVGADPLPVEECALLCTGASIDTRSIEPGHLFFALEGERTDGHLFLAKALEEGAAAAVVRRGAEFPRPRGLPLLFVEDPARALWDLAADARGRLTATVVCITGSNGKTTTKEMAGAAAATLGPCVRSERSFNNHLGVPLTILRASASTRTLVLEVGTNHPGEVARLARLARPRIAVVTNIGEAHLGHFGSLRAIAEEKADLLAALPEDGFAVINACDEFAPLLAGRTRARVCTFGRLDDGADASVMDDVDVWGIHVRRSSRPRGVRFWLYGKMRVTLPMQGLHNASNALAAIAVGLLLGAEPLAIRDALGGVEPPRLRLQREHVGGVVLVDDSYNANPASVGAALDELAATTCDGRRVFVLGDMGELGDLSDEHHRSAGRRAAASADVLWAVGPRAGVAAEAALAAGMPAERVFRSPDVARAAENPAFLPKPGDVVMLKASRAVELDRLARALRDRLAPGSREREAV
jgi:UDP-N-acetylmuramoyl-tripeptide--D-alanyl-D-alanine ligase